MKVFSFLFLIFVVTTQCTPEQKGSSTSTNDTLERVELNEILNKLDYSEILKTMDSIHQVCLDEGVDMLNCSKKHYAEMDSILNDVYNKLMKNKNNQDKTILKKEQLAWLKERDQAFIDFDNEKISELSAYDNQTISLNKKADFVKERIEILILKSNK